MPSRLLSNRSPYEVLFNTIPKYEHLRVFGCLCFAYNINYKHKFDARSKPGIFVGYPFGQKGYRIFDPETKKKFTSRDVIFHETVFPYKNVHDHTNVQHHVIPKPTTEIPRDNN